MIEIFGVGDADVEAKRIQFREAPHAIDLRKGPDGKIGLAIVVGQIDVVVEFEADSCSQAEANRAERKIIFLLFLRQFDGAEVLARTKGAETTGGTVLIGEFGRDDRAKAARTSAKSRSRENSPGRARPIGRARTKTPASKTERMQRRFDSRKLNG